MSHSPQRCRILILFIVLAAVLLLAGLTAAGAQAGGSSRAPSWLHKWTPAGLDDFSTGAIARAGTGDLYIAGELYHTSTSRYGWCVARYTEAGTRKWVHSLTKPTGDHRLTAVAADAAGNVILVGNVHTASHDNDWLVGKWSRAGKPLWRRQVDGTAHGADGARDVAVAPDGSIVVVGSIRTIVGSDDGYIVKYSPAGKVLWSHRIDGASHSGDSLTAVAVDTAGYVYAAGFDYVTARADDALLIRYSSKGHALWTRHWGDPVALKHEWFSDVAVRNGYVAAAGITENDPSASNWENRGLVVKYSTAHGTLKWDREFVNSTLATREADWTLVGIDSKGRVATAGWEATSDSLGEGAWITCVYSAAGTQSPTLAMSGTTSDGNFAMALAATVDGHFYETGCLSFSGTGQDLYTIALNSAGTPLWGSVLNDAANANDIGGGVVTTSKAVYVGADMWRSLTALKYKR